MSNVNANRTVTLTQVAAALAVHFDMPSLADVTCCLPDGRIEFREGAPFKGGFRVRMPTGAELLDVGVDGRLTDREGGWLVERLPSSARLRKLYLSLVGPRDIS